MSRQSIWGRTAFDKLEEFGSIITQLSDTEVIRLLPVIGLSVAHTYCMNRAMELLNRVLAKSQPDDTVKLTLTEATCIAGLGERELERPLLALIADVGIPKAFEMHGLFARRVVIH